MKKGTRLTTPTKNFIKELKDSNGKSYYSFFHNKSQKKKDSEEWEIVERYVISVMNIVIEPQMDIQVTDIIEAKPQIMYDKNKKQYLNCLLWVNADVIKSGNENNEKYVPNEVVSDTTNNQFANKYQEDDDDLPF